MNNEELLNKVVYLQEKIAWLESSQDELLEHIGKLVDKIDDLEVKLKVCEQKASGESAVRPLSEETPPPHY